MDWYAEVLAGTDLGFCRLRVDEDELRRRNAERGSAAQDWDSVRREARQLDAAQLAHPTVETAGLTPAEVAAAVWARLGRQTSVPATPRVHRGAEDGIREWRPGQIIWLCGPAAVGKSTVAWQVFSALLQDEAVTGYLDLRQLGFLGGPAATAEHALQAVNVAAVWDLFGRAGATHLVLSGAVQTQAQVQLYRAAMPAAHVTLYRLRASKETLARRTRARAGGSGPRLAGDQLVNEPNEVVDKAVSRAWLEQQQLDGTAIGDVVLDTYGVTAVDVAAHVLHRSGFERS
jgi:chloramphenicol 3-O-phosphotransferase